MNVNDAVETNKATARRWMQEVLNEGQLDALDQLAAPGYTYHGPGIELHGRSELKAFLQHVLATFPDLETRVERMAAEGDLVAMHFVMSGTQAMDFLGIPARGARLELDFHVFSRFEDGKVVEDWEVYDTAEMRRQLEAGALVAV